MKGRYTPQQIEKCRELALTTAHDWFDRFLSWCNSQGINTPDQMKSVLFDDWTAFSEDAGELLYENGLGRKPSDYHHKHEYAYIFKIFTTEYEKATYTLIERHFGTYLRVPFSEKEAAKNMGAKWDSGKRMWYAPYDSPETLRVKWPAV